VRLRSAVVAALCFAAFVALGLAVERRPDPPALLTWEVTLQNHSALLAWWLTWACYVQVLVPLSIALLIVAWRVPGWRGRIVFSIVMLVLCWQGATLFQHVFARPRRIDWVVRHETAFSYPSSHAAIVAGFYLLWAALLAVSDTPALVRRWVAGLLVLLSLGVLWSRLSLGAHYLTDLLGGILLGVAIVAAAWTLVPVKVVAGRAGI
jgi:membrane-associated phospholipid phosphatase